MNRKVGKTKSVGVNPCQEACFNGPYVNVPFPEVLTKIMAANVIPRRMSNERKRDFIFIGLAIRESLGFDSRL